MDGDRDDATGLDRTSFEGRFLVEIDTWDCNLHVGMSTPLTPMEYRFQGGLSYVRSFELSGRIVAPIEHESKLIRAWLSPFGPTLKFEIDDLDQVGQLTMHPSLHHGKDFSATLLVPESSLSMTATCLVSVWKYLHIWTSHGEGERASVSAFSFSSTVHKNLDGWIAGI